MAFYSKLTEIKPKKAKYAWKIETARNILELGKLLVDAIAYPCDEYWWYETSVSNGSFSLTVYTNRDDVAKNVREVINDRT